MRATSAIDVSGVQEAGSGVIRSFAVIVPPEAKPPAAATHVPVPLFSHR
jgi:hypothetical protein